MARTSPRDGGEGATAVLTGAQELLPVPVGPPQHTGAGRCRRVVALSHCICLFLYVISRCVSIEKVNSLLFGGVDQLSQSKDTKTQLQRCYKALL